MDTREDGSPIRILHLSDFHFSTRKQWDSDPILRALAQFIADDIAENELYPDLVAITGDLAQSGKPKEYELARQWLDDLWPRLARDPAAPLARDRLLLVPGNHDVDWGQIEPGARDAHKVLLETKTQDAVTERLAKKATRDLLLKRHAAYLKSCGAWHGQRQTLPWWQRDFNVRGRRLHVAGLDSAWLAGGDDDSRLLLGTYQINQTVLHKDAESNFDWHIALLHHPWASLAEFDRIAAQPTIHRHRDLVLRGHLHEPDVSRIVPPDLRRACVEAAAGCCYSGKPYPNAFQWIELYSDPRRIRFHFRCWNQDDWQVDRNQHGCPDGTHTMDLPARDQGPAVKPPSPSAPIDEAEGRAATGPTGAVPIDGYAIREAAITAISAALDALPCLRLALAAQAPAFKSATADGIAAWLCAFDAERFRGALGSFKGALEKAAGDCRRSQVDLSILRKQAIEILGWMSVTAVLDGYHAEDAPLVQAWFDGAAFRIPLGRSACLEVLSACWGSRKAEFGPDRGHWDCGPYNITPAGRSEPGIEDLFRLGPEPALDYLRRLIYQHIEGKSAPMQLHQDEWEEVRQRLRIQLRDKKRRRRLVIDGRRDNDPFDYAAILDAIHRDVPEVHLIVIVGPTANAGDIFLLPASEFSAYIKECLEEIENIQ